MLGESPAEGSLNAYFLLCFPSGENNAAQYVVIVSINFTIA